MSRSETETSLRGRPPSEIFDRALTGERRALGRLLSWVERGGDDADAVSALAHQVAGSAQVVGITGAPGAGKSTLVGQLVEELVRRGKQPAVLAVDPSSPLTGGAILGDRVRMGDAEGEQVFIRSMATRGHAGGLALAVPAAVRLFDATGYDPVVIETVGVGQVEVDVASAADTTVVVVTPGWGDAVQANKAGLLEVADIFVVNKADRPGAKDACRDLELMLDLSHVTGVEDVSGYRPPIVLTDALDGNGVAELWDRVDTHRRHLEESGQSTDRHRRRLRAEIAARLELALAHRTAAALDGPSGQAVLDDVVARRRAPADAASALLATMTGGP